MLVRIWFDAASRYSNSPDRDLFRDSAGRNNTAVFSAEWCLPTPPRVGECIAPELLLWLLDNRIDSNDKFNDKFKGFTEEQREAILDDCELIVEFSEYCINTTDSKASQFILPEIWIATNA